jgi:parvulin-like peptidyl-prolyl isomerase
MSASREKKKRQELRETGELQQDKKKKSGKKLSSKAKGRIYTAIAIVFLAVFALLIFVNSGFIEGHATAVTVGDHKVTPVEYNYYYMDTYYTMYSYYGDYAQYFMSEDTVLSTMQQTYTLLDEAEKAGYQLDDETLASIAETMETLESSATSNGYKNADTYLEASFGKGSSAESYEAYLTNRQIASGYSTVKSESFTYTDDEIAAYYAENVNDFDLVTFRYFFVDGSADDDEDAEATLAAAEATAATMAAAASGNESAFLSQATENTEVDDDTEYDADSSTLYSDASYSTMSSYYGSDIADWLFDTTRLEGETTYIANSSETGYYVLYFSSRNTLDYNTVNVRHILISAEDSSDEDSMAEALAQAEEILAEYEAGEQTAEAFAALAEEYSTDTGSNTNGGLYENVYQGQMVTNFNDWCFDESRQVGDTGIVESSYGYHVMYFDGYGDVYRGVAVEDTLRDNDYDAWYEEVSAAYEPVTSSFGMRFVD